jgi:multisubunit Na+/H+ antiporter MnhB subunit
MELKMVMMVTGFFGMVLLLIGFDRKQSETTNLKESGTSPMVVGVILILITIIIYYILNKEMIHEFFGI